jgi:glucose/arabinose dehydrogenase
VTRQLSRRIALLLGAVFLTAPPAAHAAPEVLDPSLGVRTAAGGLSQPTGMAFIGPDDALVLEKATGRVRRVVGGVVTGTALDLAVNSASERGLLGIALHPNFGANGFVYLYWTASSTSSDSTALAEVPLLGNRVDRFLWNG